MERGKRKSTETETGQTPTPTKRIGTRRGTEDIMVASEIDNAGPQNQGLDQQQQQRASSGTVTEVVITGGREDPQQESSTSRRSGDVEDWMTSTPLPPPNQDGITTMADNICNKCRDLTDLKPAQIHVYHGLHTVIDDDEPRVILLDAPSGTGKTHIISNLAKKYGDRVSFAVFHRDHASEVNAETHADYMCKIFNLTFNELRSFRLDYCNNIEVLRKLLIVAQEYKSSSTRAIIVDDCSVMNPLMVVALYLVSLMNKITLIFSGNRRQLGYMCKTKLHSRNYEDNDLERIYFDFNGWDGRSNFDVLELISDPEISQEFTRTLIENHRSSDQGFLEKVQRFGNAVARYKITERAPFHFNLRYLLYTLFKGKFDLTLEDSSDNLFMAQFNNVIMARMNRMMAVNDTKTYHAVLGRTIWCPVELSIERNHVIPENDFSDATAVYVGLCSLTSESNIKKIHAAQDLLASFRLTDHMSAMDKQDYYYRCDEFNGRNDIIYTEVDTICEFENVTPVCKKIKRSVYETNMRNEDMNADSPLMKITKFFRDNAAAVRDVFTENGNSGVNETALSEAYDAWESRIMNE